MESFVQVKYLFVPMLSDKVVQVSSGCVITRGFGSKACAEQVALHRNNVFCGASFSYTLVYTPLALLLSFVLGLKCQRKERITHLYRFFVFKIIKKRQSITSRAILAHWDQQFLHGFLLLLFWEKKKSLFRLWL